MESNQLVEEVVHDISEMDITTTSSSALSPEHINSVPETRKIFSRYQSPDLSSIISLRSQTESLIESVDWEALREYAAAKRRGIDCSLFPNIGYVYGHKARIIEFTDGVQWLAQLRLPSLYGRYSSGDSIKTNMECEFHTVSLLRQRTSLPIPEIHAYDTRSDCCVKAPFILMDWVEGSDSNEISEEDIPYRYKQTLLSGLAKIHVQLSKVLLPQIGTIVSLNADGTCQQGPIPGLGGPFNTATEFFRAWAAKVKAGLPEDRREIAEGRNAAEIISSVLSFPESISRLADRLSVLDSGPFPLCHGSFSHHNLIIDDAWQILGVIGWDTAFAGPWEIFGDFPLSFSPMPRAMDFPHNYTEDGVHKNRYITQRLMDQENYVVAVEREENQNGGTPHRLADTLRDSKRQQLATAMRLYEKGTRGFYENLIHEFELSEESQTHNLVPTQLA
ncbi:hypothetical protein F5B22DRAFT_59121 [Xylaria bambusicola]|uniref:uncharacterized protein n=1 Tax=Xylaria bambusicola TaxID=326684 RepID=UPI002007DAAC|nr:uncharacterized protein F5B22DRAFT_59121 [Xylaria bambusicola]KAI0502731.1 hypothetical protein F5B22DRAFT_59121 [Xylaria bambusicola]